MEKTYWGILCRACSEPVAFNTRPYHEFGLGSASVRPGAIRCSHGHNHIYFPARFPLRSFLSPDHRSDRPRKSSGVFGYKSPP